ncbi:MAG: glycosyltransferase family 2 protein [Sarcina sp.]
MENIKVSILIPVYNAENFLKACLDSVINQTLKDIEIIVTNDGSKDNSEKIINDYMKIDNRIQYIKQDNKGLGATRNGGIVAASGEYIAFLDSDDWVDLEFYEKLYNRAIETEADLVVAPHIVEVFDKSYVKNISNIFGKDKYLEGVLDGEVEGFSWNKLYKRSLIIDNNLKFPVRGELENVEDQYFTIRSVYYANKLEFIKNSYLHYRCNLSSIVNTYQKTLIEDIQKLYIENKKLLNNDSIYIEFMQKNLLKGIIGILFNEFKADNTLTKAEKIEQFKKIREKDIYMEALKSLNKNTLATKDYKMLEMLRDEKLNKLYIFMFLRTKLMQMRRK